MTVVGALLLLGFGYAFFSTPNTSVIMGCLDKRYLGVASGLTGTMRSLGMTFSMVVVTLSFSHFMNGQAVSVATIPSFMRSMQSNMWFFCALSVFRIRSGKCHHRQTRTVPARTGQGVPFRSPTKAIHPRRRVFFRRSGVLKSSAALLRADRSENRQTDPLGSRTNANVRQLFRPLRETGGRKPDRRHVVLCKKKNDALVEITLPEGTNIHAREYRLYLPDKELLRRKLKEWSAEVERLGKGVE